MPLTKLETELRPIARERVTAGVLPCQMSFRMWAGRGGNGNVCALCDKPVDTAEVEYEVQAGGEPSVYFHMVCQSIWQLECARADYLSKHPDAPPPSG